jgi:hypothetical protein
MSVYPYQIWNTSLLNLALLHPISHSIKPAFKPVHPLRATCTRLIYAIIRSELEDIRIQHVGGVVNNGCRVLEGVHDAGIKANDENR